MTLKIAERLACAALLLLPTLVHGYGEPYEQARFDALAKAGKAVVVHIHAPWCPTCLTQDKHLAELLKRPENQGITALEVSFDDQKEVVKAFRLNRQSAILFFKGGKEVGLLLGETRQARIAELIAQVR
jgi:thiol-disulfide isomerase/thioredoxin